MESLRFLTPELARSIRDSHGTPVYVYDLATLRAQAQGALDFPNAFGLTARYAMKACPNAAILQIFLQEGLHIDASSGFEVDRALRAGVPPEKISLSSQEWPKNAAGLHKLGVKFNACSLMQLERFGERFPGSECGLRFNPGLGSGSTSKTNVGGTSSSFGIWHEWQEQAREIAESHQLKITRIHTHIGSGSDPAVWQRVAGMSLDLVRAFDTVDTLNLGGGYKVALMSDEVATDLQEIGAPVKQLFEDFAKETGRRLHLEIEPGKYLVANAGCLLTTVQDIVSTGEGGHTFIKLDSGMTDILRPSLYASQHPVVVIPEEATNDTQPYIVVGHCCESGDLLTPAVGDPEALAPRELTRATIGDLCVIEGTGAYCAAMSAKNYNSFPESPEVLVDEQGQRHLIRERQSLEQVVANEVKLELPALVG
ncbi:MAG: diaminopimelate decarboxylase [Opitutales bacterium]